MLKRLYPRTHGRVGSAVRLYLLAAFDTTGVSEAKCQRGKLTRGRHAGRHEAQSGERAR